MMGSLFRREAEVQNSGTPSERVLALDGWFFRFAILAILVLAMLVIIYFALGSYTQKQTVTGYVISGEGLAEVHAPYGATVLKRYVSADEIVAAGDPLYQLATRRSSPAAKDIGRRQIDMLQQRRTVLATQKTKAKRAAELEQARLKARIPIVRSQLAALHRELAVRHEALQLQKSDIARLEKMLDSAAVSRSAYEKKRAQYLERKAAVSALERNALGLKSELQDLKSRLQVTRIRNANRLADYDKELALLEQEIIRVSSGYRAVVRAPVSGVATGVVYEPGQYVTPKMSLLAILPASGKLRARLLVPSRAIGFIERGQRVNLRYQAFPYQQYGTYEGEVLRVSRSVISPGEASLPVAIQAPVYVVTVELARQSIRAYGREIPLQAGMMLEADIVTGKMKLYEWLLQPLYRLQGTL